MATPHASRPSVAIIGAGWAGLACALKLARAGYRPAVFESAPEPGGRARRARIDNTWRDNGQHLILGGCGAISRLLDDINVTLARAPFAYTDGKRSLSLAGRKGKSGLLLALLQARGFSWAERLSLFRALLQLHVRNWQTPADQTVAAWLHASRQPPNLISAFWEPLALAVLNTPIDCAAMARFAPVLRDTLGRGCQALEIWQPAADLSECVVTPLVRAIESAGGQIRTASRITAVAPMVDSGYKLSLTAGDSELIFDKVVLAIPPWSLDAISLPFDPASLITRFRNQPIATVYLGFDNTVRLKTPLLQLAGPTVADAHVWAIDRTPCGEPGVIAVSLSAEGAWTTLDHETLAQHCIHQLRIATGISHPCLWHKVVCFRRATPKAVPNAWLSATAQEPLPELFLSGDWTHPDYPATLEAAVQSGNATASRVMRDD